MIDTHNQQFHYHATYALITVRRTYPGTPWSSRS